MQHWGVVPGGRPDALRFRGSRISRSVNFAFHYVPLAQALSTACDAPVMSDGRMWEGISCAICMQDLSWASHIAAHPPPQEWFNRPPEGHHFMHGQCPGKNLVQYDNWNCPCCMGCLKNPCYTIPFTTPKSGHSPGTCQKRILALPAFFPSSGFGRELRGAPSGDATRQ